MGGNANANAMQCAKTKNINADREIKQRPPLDGLGNLGVEGRRCDVHARGIRGVGERERVLQRHGTEMRVGKA